MNTSNQPNNDEIVISTTHEGYMRFQTRDLKTMGKTREAILNKVAECFPGSLKAIATINLSTPVEIIDKSPHLLIDNNITIQGSEKGIVDGVKFFAPERVAELLSQIKEEDTPQVKNPEQKEIPETEQVWNMLNELGEMIKDEFKGFKEEAVEDYFITEPMKTKTEQIVAYCQNIDWNELERTLYQEELKQDYDNNYFTFRTAKNFLDSNSPCKTDTADVFKQSIHHAIYQFFLRLHNQNQSK